MKRLVIVDLEATCWADDDPVTPEPQDGCRYVGEIIEIGAASLWFPDFTEGGSFSRFVQPKNNPILSDFCKELTTIRQEDVDQARTFPEVVAQFARVFDLENDEVLVGSWGAYDRKQIVDDYTKWDMEVPGWAERHVNLKDVAKELLGLPKKRRVSGAKTMETLGVERVGTMHRGVDDALTYAEIIRKLVEVHGSEKVTDVILSKVKEFAASPSAMAP